MHQGGFNISSTASGGDLRLLRTKKKKSSLSHFKTNYFRLIQEQHLLAAPQGKSMPQNKRSSKQPGIYRLRRIQAGPHRLLGVCQLGSKEQYPKVLHNNASIYSRQLEVRSPESCANPEVQQQRPLGSETRTGESACFQEELALFSRVVQVVRNPRNLQSESTGVMLIFLPGETPL
jgi:hypothetical protein